MDREDETFKVLIAVLLVGALVIAMLTYGCGHEDQGLDNDGPLPAILR